MTETCINLKEAALGQSRLLFSGSDCNVVKDGLFRYRNQERVAGSGLNDWSGKNQQRIVEIVM